MTLPRHKNPTSPNRIASAPYNFVELPDAVVPAVASPDQLPSHDRYHEGTYGHTGHFDITLETGSPLYIRTALSPDQFKQARKDNSKRPYKERPENTPDFFHRGDPAQPVIPGSSLRGMIRSLVEIVSYGKVHRVTDEHLFFRSVDTTTIGKDYRERMVGHTRAGFLVRRGRGYALQEASLLRVHKNTNGFPGGTHRGAEPSWKHQHKRVWVQYQNDLVTAWSESARPGYQEGRLVLTGTAPKKRKEFVFLLPSPDAQEWPVPENMLKRFHDNDQLTKYQRQAFPKDKPASGARKQHGFVLQNPKSPGDPVFFLIEGGDLTFFGRAGMFRLPYSNSPLDLVPEKLRRSATEQIDFPTALFGVADPDTMRAGRITVSDATLVPGQGDVRASAFTPAILTSPNPTSFQQYLVQSTDNKKQLKHYDSKGTTIRGHKLYWHQDKGNPDVYRAPEHGQDAPAPDSTQHTYIRPVRTGTRFRFRIHFENVSAEELGALCWALKPRGKGLAAHKLGMGKPLGLGSVVLDPTLHLDDRPARYRALISQGRWATPGAQADLKPFQEAFERHVIDRLWQETGATNTQPSHLAELQRIAQLLKLMAWPGQTARPEAPRYLKAEGRPNTRYQVLDEFKQRPVLPGPNAWGDLIGSAAPITPGSASPTPSARSTPKKTGATRPLRDYSGANESAVKWHEAITKTTNGVYAKVVDNTGKPLRVALCVRSLEGHTFDCMGTGNPAGFDVGTYIVTEVSYSKKKKKITQVVFRKRS